MNLLLFLTFMAVSQFDDSGQSDLRRGRRQRSATEVRATVDRLPPHSIEAEQGVLGCIFLSAHECLPQCIEKFRAGSRVLYDLRHQVIYENLVEMFDAREAIDVITVQQRLKDKQQLADGGGIAYLASLPDFTPSAANLTFYLSIVREKYILRKMISVCTDVVSRVYEHSGEVDELIDEVERDILKLSDERAESKWLTIKEVVHQSIGRLEQYHQSQGALTGISTGFPDLDKLTTGLHGGEMIVIAGRPSSGKSAICMNIADAVAVEQRLPVGVFSLEMSAESLVLRMLCSRARVNLRNLREGFFTERDFPKITSAAGKLAAAPLYIDDTAALSILALRAKARRMWQQYGIKLFVIDYLQLLTCPSRKGSNRQEQVAEISGGVKALAKELNVPVIVLAQLNREMEREKRRPRMSDLRESGACEADADLIGLLYQPKTGEDDEPEDAVPVNLLIAKQRNGPTGDVHLTFLKTFTKFESAAKISPNDLPLEDNRYRHD